MKVMILLVATLSFSQHVSEEKEKTKCNVSVFAEVACGGGGGAEVNLNVQACFMLLFFVKIFQACG